MDELLFLSFDSPLQLLDVFFRRQLFRLDAPLAQHVTHAFVVLHMLAGDGVFSLQVILADVVIGYFGGQILRGNGQWVFFWKQCST